MPNRLRSWFPGAYRGIPVFPSILASIWFCFCHVTTVPPFPLLGFFTFLGGRLGNGPWHTIACSGCWPWQDIRHRKSCYASAPSPLAGRPTTFQLPGVQFLAFVCGAGGGTTSLALHLHLEAKVAPLDGQDTVCFVCVQVARGKTRMGVRPARCVVSCCAIVLAVRELQRMAPTVSPLASGPPSM